MSDTEIKEPKVKKEKPPKTPKAPKQPKAPKEAKAKKAKKAKKSKYPDWYIGPPKPMKTKKFVFHKPTKKFWIGLGFTLVILAFPT